MTSFITPKLLKLFFKIFMTSHVQSSQHYKDGVGLETLVKQCKGVCAIGAELVEQHLTTVIGNAKNEDVVFHIKQVFERIQSDHSILPTFKDYHTVCTFTRTIHSECKKRAAAVAAATAVITTPAEPTPTKATATSGKAKALKAPAKRSRRLANLRAIIEDSSDEEASVVAATEEDTIMGNPDASSTPPETDPVLIPSAAICRKADTIILCFEQMNIDKDVDVIVNRDPTASNIVEGHKVPLPKFLKNKKAAQAAQREKEKAERRAEAIQAAEATIAKGKAIEAANQAMKHPRASTDHAFKDSPYTIAAADLAINNEASQGTIDTAASLVIAGDHVNPSESYLCFQYSKLAEFKVPHQFTPVSSASQPNSEGGCTVISAFWYLQLAGIVQFFQ
ncbi:uncharacterized protein ARMOST_19394 [Armillaria ostoyae]|uniref:Uncharacterized protein n=1 Tax=Armillaria ostoyae TaxID=47428 RepID=A0A284S4J0_ARMOS|nr:uncharacterized protein ARMOST_19394 [Armillaria ostoyae]